MTRSRLVLLGLAVTGLVVLAAMAASGRPLGAGGRGAGPTAGFFDYVYTTLVILVVAGIALRIALLFHVRHRSRPKAARGRHHLASMLGFLAAVAIVWALVHTGFEKRLQQAEQRAKQPQPAQTRPSLKPPPAGTRGARIQWGEVAVVLGLLGAAGAVFLATRSRKRPPPARRRASQEAISAALDESLDDLRAEPDLRRAIIAAYARMERALAVGGLPRRPSEAPLEYLERALLELETSAGAVSRLTHLFEWAKFSQHAPEPRMRDEAIDALVAVRDELRAPQAVTA